jgi:hypothetical protein
LQRLAVRFQPAEAPMAPPPLSNSPDTDQADRRLLEELKSLGYIH